MFGNNKPAFGSSSTFGSPGSTLFGNQAKPAGSLFGQSTNTGSSLFGQKSTTNLFGSPSTQSNTGSIFGGTQQTSNTGSSLFGQNKTSMFGGANTTSNTFGGTNNTSSGLFGSSTTNTSGSLFGGGGGGTNAPNGTTIKFNPPVAMDTMNKSGNVQNIQTKHYCITAMKDYESKSLEELRVDDYMANRKTPSASGGLFGGNTSNTGSSLFGGSSNQQKPSLFGSSTNATSTFGGANNTQSNSLFGGSTNNNNNTGSSLFGAKPATTGLFGSTAQNTSSTFGSSSFGTAANTTSFGANNNNQQSSVFGNTSFGQNTSQPSSGGLFGSTNTTGGFGQTNTNTGGGLFGGNNNSTASTSLFGNKPAAAATNTGFGFGSNNATTSTFGNTSNTGGGLFGNANTAAKPGGLFGSTTATNTTGSLFGNTAQPTQSGGLFGSTQPAQTGGGLFGNNAAQNTSAVVQNPATVSVSAPVIVLGSDVNETQVKMAMINAQLAASPYGNSPLLKLTNDDSDDKPNPISVSRQMRFLAAKANGVSSPLNTSTSAANTSINTSANTSTLKTSFLSGQAPVAGSKLRRSNVPSGQDLNYKSMRKPPTLGNGLRDKGSANVSLNESSMNISRNKITDVDAAVDKALSNNENVPGSRKKSNIKYLDLNSIRKSAISNSPKGRTNDPDELPCYSDSVVEIASPSSNPRDAALQREEALRREPPKLVLDQSSLDESALNTSQSSQLNSSAVNDKNSSVLLSSPSSAPGGVTLACPDYYCEPTIKEMTNMVVNGKVIIPNGLTVGRASYGSVFWPGKIELSNIALDEVIVFRHKEVTVYPDDSVKPALGEELNKEAEVTLERVWHVDKHTKEEIRDPLVLADIGWRDRLERVTAKMGAIFKDYRPASGSWVFKVEHFSKYGLPDNEGGDMVCDTPPVPPRDSVLTERNVQSKVQRASLQLEKGRNFNESVVEHEDDENQYVAKISQKPQKVLGLGGNNTFNLPLDDETMDFGDSSIIEEEAPPEKKLKTEDVDMIYEETKRLLEVLSPVHYHTRVVPKPIAPIRGFAGGLAAKNSVRTDGTSIDLASAHSNVSRVGWGTGGTYVVSLQPHCNSVYVKSLNWATEGCQNYISDMLEHNSRLSQFIKRNRSISAKVRHLELDGQEVSPRIKPTADHAELIDSFLATSKQSGFTEDTRVWKLCKALFPQNRGLKDDNDKIEDVSLWLSEEIANEKRMPPSVGRGATVWNALCDGQLSKAIESAFNEKLHHLAAYLSLFQIDPAATQIYFEEQVDFWKSSNSLAFVDVPVLKIYLVLAGRSSIERKVKNKTEIVNCLEGLTWKQAIGIHVWWLRGCRTFEESMSHALKAVPAPHRVDDIFFQQIFALACDATHRVEAVLDAADMLCDSPLDFHLSWHLWSVLRSVGYNTIPSEAEQRLHISYSEQLIACGLHDLALFVLSHISNNQCRASCMRDCLERIAPHSSSNLYDKINHEFYVPKQWIAEAKLVAALASNNIEKACVYAIEAGDLQTAHRLFVEDVAPNFVVLGETGRLIDFVKKFAPYSDTIQSWGQNGQIYADYAEFATMCKVDCDENIISELLTTLQSRLKAPVFNTPLQRLAAQNMSLEIVEVLKLFGRVSFEFPLNPSQVDKVTRQLV